LSHGWIENTHGEANKEMIVDNAESGGEFRQSRGDGSLMPGRFFSARHASPALFVYCTTMVKFIPTWIEQ